MASEKFANRPAAEVAVGYTATDTTLEVDDASAFPATGVFRVILDNAEGTIFRVDSVAGDVFTGAAEEFDGDASVGVGVKIVASQGAAERFLQTPDAGDMAAPSGVDGADFWAGLIKVAPLDQSAWTWFNQGSAVVNQGSKLVRLFDPSNTAGTNIRGRLLGSYPSTPFTLTVIVKPWFEVVEAGGAFTFLDSIGIAISDGTKYKNLIASNFVWGTGHGPSAISLVKANTTTTVASATEHVGIVLPTLIWLRVEDNGTNQIFSYSFDGVNYVTLLTEARTTHLTPSDIGIVMNHQSGAVPAGGDILSWLIT